MRDKHTPVLPLMEPWWHVCRHAVLHAALGGPEALDDLATLSTSLFYARAQLEEGSVGAVRLLLGLQSGNEALRLAMKRLSSSPGQPVAPEHAAELETLVRINGHIDEMRRFLRANAPQLIHHPQQLFTDALNSHPASVVSRELSRLVSGGLIDLRGSWQLVDEDRPTSYPACMATLEGHSEGVTCVSLSTSRGLLASGSADKKIKLWDARDVDAIRTLEGHSAGVTSVAWAPDGGLLASGSWDASAILWDASTYEVTRRLEGHTDSVTSIAFSPDGAFIATGSDDASIKIWRTTGDLIFTLEGHTEGVTSVAFSPTGHELASGSGDKTLRVWSTSTGKWVRTIVGHSSRLMSVAYSPSGSVLASSGANKAIRLWSAATGALMITLEGHTGAVSSICYSSDGNLLASGSFDKTVRVWSVSTGQCIRTLEGTPCAHGPVHGTRYTVPAPRYLHPHPLPAPPLSYSPPL